MRVITWDDAVQLLPVRLHARRTYEARENLAGLPTREQ
jgi:hypothetical protein